VLSEAAPLTLLANAVRDLRDIVSELGADFPTPDFVPLGSGMYYRHKPEDRTPHLACYLKAVKICSTLRAAVALVGIGHAHEAYALCRVCDEQGEDIYFLIISLQSVDGRLDAIQEQFLTEFYQEEWADPEDVLSNAARNRVSRQKIRAAILASPEFGLLDPSRAVAVGRSIAQTFSGFVHGAYVHILDMYGPPGKYYMTGFKGTPRMEEALRTIPSYVFRGMMAVEALSFSTGRHDLVTKLKGLSSALNTLFAE
jgi:hypothetical protein